MALETKQPTSCNNFLKLNSTLTAVDHKPTMKPTCHQPNQTGESIHSSIRSSIHLLVQLWDCSSCACPPWYRITVRHCVTGIPPIHSSDLPHPTIHPPTHPPDLPQPSIHLSIQPPPFPDHPSVHPPDLPNHPSTHPPTRHPPTHPPTRPSPTIQPSIHLSIYPSNHPSPTIHPSTHQTFTTHPPDLPNHPSTHPPTRHPPTHPPTRPSPPTHPTFPTHPPDLPQPPFHPSTVPSTHKSNSFGLVTVVLFHQVGRPLTGTI